MDGTTAVQNDVLKAANGGHYQPPLCPACHGGRLHPYEVRITLSVIPAGYHGVGSLVGWVAICQGNEGYLREQREEYERNGWELGEQEDEVPPCGFSLPMQPLGR